MGLGVSCSSGQPPNLSSPVTLIPAAYTPSLCGTTKCPYSNGNYACTGCTKGNLCANNGCCAIGVSGTNNQANGGVRAFGDLLSRDNTNTDGSGCTGCPQCCRTANPAFNKQCKMNAVLILDNSLSLAPYCETQVVPAVSQFVQSLVNIVNVGGTMNLGVEAFSNTAEVIFQMAPVTAAYIQQVQTWVTGGRDGAKVATPEGRNVCPYCTNMAGTNWGAALIKAGSFAWSVPQGEQVDIFLWFTDGYPEYANVHVPQTTCSYTCYDFRSTNTFWSDICTNAAGNYDSSECPLGNGAKGLSNLNNIDDNKDTIQGLFAACTAADYLKSRAKLFLIAVGGIAGNENSVQVVTGRNAWDGNSATFSTSDYYIASDFSLLGKLFADLVNGLCSCLQVGPPCTNTNANYCRATQFSARYRVTTTSSSVSTTWPANAVSTGYVYYSYRQSPDTRIKWELFDVGTAITATNPAIVRTDLQNPCQVTRQIVCASGCYKISERLQIPRFFRETADTACATCRTVTGCSAFTKVYSTPVTQEMTQHIWVITTAGATEGMPCAAQAFDGTFYEFFPNLPTSTPGVSDFGVAPKVLPADTTAVSFTDSTTCTTPTCGRDVNLVFLIDEQASCSQADYNNILAFIVSIIGGLNYQSSATKFGLAYSQSPVNTATPGGTGLQSGLASYGSLTTWANLMSGHTKRSQAANPNFATKAVEAVNFYFSGAQTPAPRELMTIICGADSATTADVTALNTLLTSKGVENWAIGVASGASLTTTLAKYASTKGYVHYNALLSSNQLLASQTQLSALQLCPQGSLCGANCLGACNCLGVCKCPTCTSGNCITSTCLASSPQSGCVPAPTVCLGDACNTRSCLATTGFCSGLVPIVCNDNNACTDDTCQNGCVFTPKAANFCDDNNACTVDSCNPATGCQHATRDCNDNNICTTDTCSTTLGCQYAATNPCNDNNPCTVDRCLNGACDVTQAKDCNDNDACTIDTCNPAVVGGCVHTPRSCNDNNACTVDTCNAASGCVFTPQAASVCDLGVNCHTYGCNPATGCTDTPIPCGSCQNTNCAVADKCVQRFCVDGLSNPGCAGIPATLVGRTHTFDLAACQAATVAGSQTGYCYSVTVVCNDNNVCTADTCVSATGCVYTPIPCTKTACETVTCDAVNGCIRTDISASCDTGNKCKNKSCNPVSGCNNTDIICDDNNPCTINSCNPATGCVFTDNGVALCTPANKCLLSSCINGVGCSPTTPVTCTNTACVQFTCVAGSCQPSGSTNCDDNNACTNDFCVDGPIGAPGVGCGHTPYICDQPATCYNYTCTPGPGPIPNCTIDESSRVVCDDNSLCTTDVCLQGFGCVYTNITCNSTTGCDYPIGCDGPSGECILANITALIDLCGVCLGDYASCFLANTVNAAAIGGLAGGIVAAIVIAAVIAALLAAWFSKKGYDYWKSQSDLTASAAHTNPYFAPNNADGVMPGGN